MKIEELKGKVIEDIKQDCALGLAIKIKGNWYVLDQINYPDGSYDYMSIEKNNAIN